MKIDIKKNYVNKDTGQEAGLNEWEIQAKNQINKYNRDSESRSSSLVLYPNPVKDLLKIGGNKTGRIQLLNLSGELRYEAESIPEQGIDMRGFSSGLYLVKIISRDRSVSVRKVVKQ
jgi:hypothetical protein